MVRKRRHDDKLIRLMGIPLMGILIPNISGIITHTRYSFVELMGAYAYFIFISFVVWEGNVSVLRYLRKKQAAWRQKAYYKLILFLFLTNILYSGLVSFILLYAWGKFSRENFHNLDLVARASFTIIVSVIFISNVYELVFLNKEKEDSQANAEKLQMAKVQAELEALKTQIDPHFIFNSLNTLSFLITKDPPSAKLFNDTLAKVYRYILSNREKDLVLLKEEIEFISNYFYLLKIRYANGVYLIIKLTEMNTDNLLIPPISLQTLVENAIKHNHFSEKNPLTIYVDISPGHIIVRNSCTPKQYPIPSSHIGLTNLDNRYKLITNRNINIENDNHFFTVKLPLLKF